MSYSVNQLHRYFERLGNSGNQPGYQELMFMIGKLRSRIQFSKIDEVLEQGLHPYLKDIRHDLYAIGSALNQHYFAYR